MMMGFTRCYITDVFLHFLLHVQMSTIGETYKFKKKLTAFNCENKIDDDVMPKTITASVTVRSF